MSLLENYEIIPEHELFAFAGQQIAVGLSGESQHPGGPTAAEQAVYERAAFAGRAVGRALVGAPHADRDAQAALTLLDENVRLATERRTLFIAANYDPLTGLENRRYFSENLDQRLANAEKSCEPAGAFAIIALDLDGFKAVNDTYGHPRGDRLLTAISSGIASGLRRTDRAARMGGKGSSGSEGPELSLSTDGEIEELHISRHGGDEFLILVETNEPPRRGHNSLTPERQALLAAHRIRSAIEEAARQEELGIDTFVSTSVGIALYRPGLDRDTFLDEADIALYGSKHKKLTPEKPIVVMGSHGETEEYTTQRYPDRRGEKHAH
jgi:GGDEF domain-containing protein